ncbi:MAG: methanogenesis marker 9 domain-containing protein [Methanolinea sp.]|nr:methanogenesis marker 9 domain-containing protein [Methanolinea sp.]
METMRSFERYNLLLNGQVVRTPIALSAMAGIVDADYALSRSSHVGVAFLGGYSIDKPTMEASRVLEAGGRREFIFDDPVEELSSQVSRMDGSGLVCGLNLRGSSPESFTGIASQVGDQVIYEIDAHCRQEPMIAARAGEYLLTHTDLLAEEIRALKKADVCVSVKIRAGISPDDRRLARKIWHSGADIIHVDLMDYDYQKVRQIRNSCPLVLIANNSMNTFDRVRDMFAHGADLVSLARRADERTLAGLDAAIARYTDEHGWYNSPKQLCRGGDVRALTFCCMPVKNCPLIPMLEKVGLSREEYMRFKEKAVAGTPLEPGAQTCFGSLAWCCKDSSPCMFRDMTLVQVGLSRQEYMRLKKQLADKIVQHLFSLHADPDTC